MKTIETPLLIDDVVYKLNSETRSINYHTVKLITVYKNGIRYNAESNKFGSIEFTEDDLGDAVKLSDEDFVIDRTQVLIKTQLSNYIDKPVWDTFTKQWVFLKLYNELLGVAELLTPDAVLIEVPTLGYGRYWGLCLEEYN